MFWLNNRLRVGRNGQMLILLHGWKDFLVYRKILNSKQNISLDWTEDMILKASNSLSEKPTFAHFYQSQLTDSSLLWKCSSHRLVNLNVL